MIYNADLDTSYMYEVGDENAVQIYEGRDESWNIYNLQSIIDNLQYYNQLVAYSLHDESDDIIDLHFLGDDYTVSIYYDKVKHMLREYTEVAVYGDATVTINRMVTGLDENVQLDDNLFVFEGE